MIQQMESSQCAHVAIFSDIRLSLQPEETKAAAAIATTINGDIMFMLLCLLACLLGVFN